MILRFTFPRLKKRGSIEAIEKHFQICAKLYFHV